MSQVYEPVSKLHPHGIPAVEQQTQQVPLARLASSLTIAMCQWLEHSAGQLALPPASRRRSRELEILPDGEEEQWITSMGGNSEGADRGQQEGRGREDHQHRSK